MATARERLHQLVEKLPEYDLHAARRYLEFLAGTEAAPASDAEFRRILAEAPTDDEPETEEERAAVAEAKAEVARGEVEPWGKEAYR